MAGGISDPIADEVWLRDITESDLPLFFAHQQERDAVHMAAFTSADPSDRGAFNRHWQRIMADDTVVIRTILVDDRVAGHVLSYIPDGAPEVSYWLGSEFWGRGIATRALRMFLDEHPARPVFARAARDNVGSIRVLQKCGFTIYGRDSGFANARGEIIPEALLRLD